MGEKIHTAILEKNKNDITMCRINIRLTSRCNQVCKSCNTHKYIIDNEISLEEIENFVDEAISLYKIKNIAFTGGEPTIRPDFLEIVKNVMKE